MGLNCKKQVGKMKSIIVKVENDLEKERQLMKKKIEYLIMKHLISA